MIADEKYRILKTACVSDGPKPNRRYSCKNNNLVECMSGRGLVDDSIAISRLVGEKLIFVAGDWPITPPDLTLMAYAVAIYKPHLIFDWGTNVGNSARIFHWISVCCCVEAAVHSIDLPIGVLHPENISDPTQRGVLLEGLDVNLHTGDGVEISLAIYKRAGRDRRALFHIDGDHGVDTVFRELVSIHEQARGSVILLDDCHESGPVREALRRFQELYGLFYRIDLSLGLPGKGLLTPSS